MEYWATAAVPVKTAIILAETTAVLASFMIVASHL
jgi:hypothetical protein